MFVDSVVIYNLGKKKYIFEADGEGGEGGFKVIGYCWVKLRYGLKPRG